MAMTPREYDKMLKESSPPTRSGRSLPMAFVVGGLICVVGQALTQCYLSLGLGREEAGAWCSVTLIFLSVLTTGLGWYQRLAKYAGAGTLVPITGFANAMSSPAIEFKSEGMVLGLAACGSTTPEVPKDDPQTPAETPTQDSVTPDEPQTGKTLVVYYSASGHTRQVAQAIAQAAELNKGV